MSFNARFRALSNGFIYFGFYLFPEFLEIFGGFLLSRTRFLDTFYKCHVVETHTHQNVEESSCINNVSDSTFLLEKCKSSRFCQYEASEDSGMRLDSTDNPSGGAAIN